MAEKKIVRATKPGLPIDPKNELFYIYAETYTLGQPLSHMLLAHPDVKFAGVNKVHPSDNYLVLKVEIKQTSDTTAVEVLKQVLTDLHNQYDHILKTFETEVEKFEAKQQNKMDTN